MSDSQATIELGQGAYMCPMPTFQLCAQIQIGKFKYDLAPDCEQTRVYYGLGFHVYGLGFKVYGLGFRV